MQCINPISAHSGHSLNYPSSGVVSSYPSAAMYVINTPMAMTGMSALNSSGQHSNNNNIANNLTTSSATHSGSHTGSQEDHHQLMERLSGENESLRRKLSSKSSECEKLKRELRDVRLQCEQYKMIMKQLNDTMMLSGTNGSINLSQLSMYHTKHLTFSLNLFNCLNIYHILISAIS
jgi:hypothetical protein